MRKVTTLARLRGLDLVVSLDVSGTAVADVSLLEDHPRLAVVAIQRSKVRDISPLRSISTLTRLYVGKKQFSPKELEGSWGNSWFRLRFRD